MGKKSRLKKYRLTANTQEKLKPQPYWARIRYLINIAVLLVMISIFSIGVALRFKGLESVTSRSPDEIVYTKQASVLVNEGFRNVKSIVDEFNANKNLWILPLPHRVGYLWPVALAMKVAASTDVKVGSYVSFIFSVISLFLLIVAGLRFFNRWVTLFALLFMSVSPIELSLARRTWQDAMVGFVGFFLMYITCEVIRSPRKIAWYIFFVIVGSYGALVKESGVMLLGLCAAPILWELFVRERAFIRGAIFVSLNVLGLGASIAILSNVAGGLSNVTEALSHFREVMGSASYGAKYCSGPWYQIIKGFWILSPATTVLCGFAIINVLITNGRDVTLRKESGRSVRSMIFIMIAFVSVTTVLPNLKNLRYMSPINAPFCLLSALCVWEIISYIKSRLKSGVSGLLIAVVVVLLSVISIFDYLRFDNMIVKIGLKDLAIVSLDNIKNNRDPDY